MSGLDAEEVMLWTLAVGNGGSNSSISSLLKSADASVGVESVVELFDGSGTKCAA